MVVLCEIRKIKYDLNAQGQEGMGYIITAVSITQPFPELEGQW